MDGSRRILQGQGMKRAGRGGFFDIVSLLLKDVRVPCTPDVVRSCLISACSAASRNASLDLIELLLKEDFTPDDEDPNADCQYSTQTPLEAALVADNPKLALRLLKVPRINPARGRILKSACRVHAIEVIKAVLQDPRPYPTEKKNEALPIVCRLNDDSVLSLVLQDPNLNPNNVAALENIADEKSLAMLRLFLNHPKATIDALWLGAMIRLNFIDGVQEVIQRCPSRDGLDKFAPHETPFMLACRSGNEKIIRLVLAYVDVDPSKSQSATESPIAILLRHAGRS